MTASESRHASDPKAASPRLNDRVLARHPAATHAPEAHTATELADRFSSYRAG